jgi:curli production assembly/transport component CsgE
MKLVYWLIIILLFLSQQFSISQVKGLDSLKRESKKQVYLDPDDLEIEAIVIDETITKLGHDFYDDFYSLWEAPDTIKNYSITIQEKPLPQLGTQISISVNEIEIFRQFIQPRSEIVEEMAKYAVQLASEYVQNYATIQAELQGDDMRGTGIF